MENCMENALQEVVLVRTPAGKYVRYAKLEDIPAEFVASTMTTDELRDMRKEDLESMYSIIAGVPPKTFPTHEVALENVVYHSLKMETMVPDSPEEPRMEVVQRPRKEAAAKTQARGRRAPTNFRLSYPKGLDDVLKGLAPQAQTIIRTLVGDAESRQSLEFTHEGIVKLLNTEEVRAALATRQEPERIFAYYRSKLESRGVLVEVRA
jgi:hypothetical protein